MAVRSSSSAAVLAFFSFVIAFVLLAMSSARAASASVRALFSLSIKPDNPAIDFFTVSDISSAHSVHVPFSFSKCAEFMLYERKYLYIALSLCTLKSNLPSVFML